MFCCIGGGGGGGGHGPVYPAGRGGGIGMPFGPKPRGGGGKGGVPAALGGEADVGKGAIGICMLNGGGGSGELCWYRAGCGGGWLRGGALSEREAETKDGRPDAVVLALPNDGLSDSSGSEGVYDRRGRRSGEYDLERDRESDRLLSRRLRALFRSSGLRLLLMLEPYDREREVAPPVVSPFLLRFIFSQNSLLHP